jgi:16S rRNA processing protein RimM
MANDHIIIGRLGAPYGIKGWIKVHSFSHPISNILDYEPWYIQDQGQWQPLSVIEKRSHHKGIIALIKHCDDRDKTVTYKNRDIAIFRDQLPALKADEFYWSDLEGLQVETIDGMVLGTVENLFATGANDVMVVKNKDEEHLIPYVKNHVVKSVDIRHKKIIVDWDINY